MEAFSNPADFLLDITNGEAVSELVTPSSGTNNTVSSETSSECEVDGPNISRPAPMTFKYRLKKFFKWTTHVCYKRC